MTTPSAVKRFYHAVPAKVTECHDCGEKTMCEVVVSDPEEALKK